MPDNVNNSNVKFRRLIDDAKIDNFCYTLFQTDWSELYPIEDIIYVMMNSCESSVPYIINRFLLKKLK